MKKNQTNKKRKIRKIQICVITIIVLWGMAVVALLGKSTLLEDNTKKDDITPSKEPDKVQESIQKPTQKPTQETIQDSQIEDEETVSNNLGYGIQLEKIGSYTGIYMEDGSDTFVSGVTMVMVSNVGEDYIQYAEIIVSDGEKEALFNFSTLYPGESIVMLEQNKLPYAELSENVNAIMKNTILFTEKPDAHEDVLKIQALDGAFNVTNISDEDITGDIMIYYKNSMNDILYGGITYRGTVTGGIKAGEIRQVISEHFTKDGSRVMFVTWG